MNKRYSIKRLTLLIPIVLLLAQGLSAQNIVQNAANDAYSIKRMADSFHVQPTITT